MDRGLEQSQGKRDRRRKTGEHGIDLSEVLYPSSDYEIICRWDSRPNFQPKEAVAADRSHLDANA
jgi:hypothetical protein